MSVAADEIAGRVAQVRERVARACSRAGRDAGTVRIVAVSKGNGPEAVVAALESGIIDFGENRVQEALVKMPAVAELARLRGLPAPKWHFVGHLQSNKVGAAVGCFAILQSVDSIRLLDLVDRAAASSTQVLLEVNVAGEATKFGLAPGDVAEAVAHARGLSRVEVAGLMTVAPRVADPGQARPVFAALRELAESLGLKELSMGMTDDFEVAIEEGATMVRIGRAIFGERA
jgi:pyridoxal phosphate enzyme (YggS family)